MELVPDADYDARELLRIAAGKDPRLLFDPLTRPQAECLAELAAQRMQRVPLQYLAGEWNFLGLTFKVGPGVLCPRADSGGRKRRPRQNGSCRSSLAWPHWLRLRRRYGSL